MTQTIQDKKEEDKKQRKPSRFDNVWADALYNIISYLPATIIAWIISNIDF